MSEIAESLKPQLSSLSVQDRADLAHFLIHSLDSDTDDSVEAAWEQELAKREVDIKEAAEPAEQVFSALRQKYARS